MPPKLEFSSASYAYAGVGQCIYCGTRAYDNEQPERPLAKEHILPLAFGGNAYIPEASCRNCERVTSALEGRALRTVFGPLRIILNFPTRRPQDRPETLPVELIHFDDRREVVEVPIENYPLRIAFQGMDPPRILAPPIGNRRKITVHFLGGREQVERRFAAIAFEFKAKAAGNTIVADGDALTLLLAKIAHCEAVAIIGLDKFYPFLPTPLLKKDVEALRMFVGGDPIARKAEVHACRIGLRYVYRGRQKLIVVQMTLLAIYGFPSYEIVVGRFYGNISEVQKSGDAFHSEEIILTHVR